MGDLLIRPAQSGDAPPLTDLLNAIIDLGGTTAYEIPFTPETLGEEFMSGPAVMCCFVAQDDDGDLNGFQSLLRSPEPSSSFGEIATFARLGRAQKGTGGRLFAATRRFAWTQGLVGINATIRADNVGGLTFYSRLGFADHGVSRAAPLRDGKLVDRVIKQYRLTSPY